MNGNDLIEDNDYFETPRYLKAISGNNCSRYDWGPKKRINRYGLYSKLESKNDNGIYSTSKIGFVNQNLDYDEGKF